MIRNAKPYNTNTSNTCKDLILIPSCSPCSLVSPKVVGLQRWELVCWGVLGIPLLEKCFRFLVSRVLVPRFLGYLVQRVTKLAFHVFSGRDWSHIQDLQDDFERFFIICRCAPLRKLSNNGLFWLYTEKRYLNGFECFLVCLKCFYKLPKVPYLVNILEVPKSSKKKVVGNVPKP